MSPTPMIIGDKYVRVIRQPLRYIPNPKEQRTAARGRRPLVASNDHLSWAMFACAAVCAALSASLTVCLPVHTASRAFATGSHSADMNGVLGRGTPLLTWAPNPFTWSIAWTDGSARASLFAGISLFATDWEISLSLLSNHLITSTASLGFCALAETINVFTPTKGDTGLPSRVDGSVASPQLTPAL